jgi:2-keto-4-pentenoate hydratase/2-oxohepta-3-ene-1,7-dioic acid hydratase in catechol pathway
MKLVTYSRGDNPRLGAVKDKGIVDLTGRLAGHPTDMSRLIAEWDALHANVEQLVAQTPTDASISTVHMLAPILRPGKIFAIGLNYADHIEETGQQRPAQQTWFTKSVTAINGPFDSIQIPVASSKVDYEAELVFVIGKRCRHVPKDRAREVIFGYCAGNDVSVRDWQLATSQWTIGKSFDTHAPIGPWLVTADEIGDPHELDVRCLVNGEVRQSSNTRHLVFNVFEQVAQLSQAMTLEPGDIVFTGTPGGVGLAMKPPRWLKAGDIVRVEIARIGAIEAEMKDEPRSEGLGMVRQPAE